MVDQQLLSRILKDAMKSGRYSVGAKEVLSEMKGSKLVICARTIPSDVKKKIEEEAAKNNVKTIDTGKTSTELGRMVGHPYRISALSIRSLGEAEQRQLFA